MLGKPDRLSWKRGSRKSAPEAYKDVSGLIMDDNIELLLSSVNVRSSTWGSVTLLLIKPFRLTLPFSSPISNLTDLNALAISRMQRE
jgi:hypothetical protein